MPKKHPILGSVILLWIASLACNQSGTVLPPDPNAAQTAIVETINAIQTEATAIGNPVDATPTLELPTAAPSVSPAPESTSTPDAPQISVSFDTFCRVGPGKDYEKVGILLVGETTEVVGRDGAGEFWYVRNPDVGAEFCWMSGEYAEISGNVLILLVVTPPVAPATDFSATYRWLGQCSTNWWVNIRLQNLSGVVFKSMNLVVRDITSNTVRTQAANNFTNTDGCSAPETVESLIQGGGLLISSPEFGYNLDGHNLSVDITLCSDVNLGGGCLTKTITFTL